jgi:ABC-type nitrate/sulfonate/bicarbonate transport system substrate-binding protein
VHAEGHDNSSSPSRRFGGHLATLVPQRKKSRNTEKSTGHPLTRRPWLRYAAAAGVVAVTVAGCASGPGGSGSSGSSGGSADASVTIALPVAEPVQSPVYLASKLGYFKKQGINAHVVVLASDTAADAALVAGSVQFTSVNAVALITAAEKGVPLEDVCTEYDGPSWALVVSNSVLSKTRVSASMPLKQLLVALHGTKVAIVGTAVSAPGLILAGLLKQEGLPSDWLSLIGVSASSDLSSAYSHGEVGAVFDTQPTPDALVSNFSGKVVYNTTQMTALDQIPWEGLVGSKSYVSGNAKVDKAVCAAIGEADNYLLKNPAAAVGELGSAFPSLSPVLLKDALVAYKWAPNAGMTAAQWTTSASLLAQFGLVTKVPPSTLSGLYSTKYLPTG